MRPNDTLHWVSVVIFLTLAVIAYSRQKNNAIQIALKSFFNVRFFRQSLREETNSTIYSGRVLLINSFVIISIVLFYFSFNISNQIENKYLLFLILLGAISSLYMVNIAIKFFISRVSGLKVIENESVRYNQFFFQVLGLFLLPGVIGLYFFPNQIAGYDLKTIAEQYIIIVIIALLLNKLIQSIFQSFEIKISWFYIFLYICTLEILPLCVGFQLIISQNTM